MKKVLFILPLLAILFGSCKGDDGYDGRDGKDGSVNWWVNEIQVTDSQWKLEGNKGELDSYYYCDVSIPELTKVVYEDGNVLVYLMYTENSKLKKSLLPYSLHRGDIVDDGNGNQIKYLWTESFNCDYYQGTIRLKMSVSDFSTQYTPGNKEFYVSLTW